MIKVSVMYPNGPHTRFDMEYYRTRHVPMVIERCGGAARPAGIERGIAGGAPGSVAPFCVAGHLLFDSADAMQAAFEKHLPEFLADIPNFTNVLPTVQIAEVVLGA